MRKRSEIADKDKIKKPANDTTPRGAVGTIHLAEGAWQGSFRTRCGKYTMGPERKILAPWNDPRMCVECLAKHQQAPPDGRVSQPVYEEAQSSELARTA